MGKLDMKDIMALFRRDAEYDHRHVDAGEDGALYGLTRVLDNGVGSVGAVLGGEVVEGVRERVRRKAGSLGFGREREREDRVYGRR